MIYAITPRKIYTGEKELQNYAVIIKGDTIDAVIKASEVPQNIPLKYLDDAILAPGFIDLQVNGCGGRLFNEDISNQTLEIMHQTMLKHGTTSFLPTLISARDEDIEQAMEVVNESKKSNPSILGLHIEGPYINKNRKGIHDESIIRSPDVTMLNRICENGGGVVKIVTVAPEVISAEIIALLKKSGIVVSAGHSMATYEEAMKGFDAGITMATHLFNAMPPLYGRNPGLLGAIWERKNVVASLIADGIHVDWPNVRIAKRLKGERLCLITDAVSPAGTTMDSFMLGGKKIYHHEGKCLSEKGVLGGSALTLDVAVKNCVKHAGFSLSETLKMASTYPADVIGERTIGKIKPGYRADISIMNEELSIIATIDKGVFHSYAKECLMV